MRQYLLPKEGTFYKSNLHSHSTISDGPLDPLALKEAYKKAGYQVLVYTDHNTIVDHSHLNDDSFLAMTGVEIDAWKDGPQAGSYRPWYHVNFFHRDQHFVTLPEYPRSYERFQEVIEAFLKQGFIAMVCHPALSLQGFEDYRDLEHVFAMEIYNHHSFVKGYDEVNQYLYDQLLRSGKRWFCTATDDAHSKDVIGTVQNQMFGGFCMIKAKDLSQASIFDALQAGHFYASTGPLIYELYIEEQKLHIKTSPVKKIALTTGYRKALVEYPATCHGYVEEAVFDLSVIRPGYLRITITDSDGHFAWTQPVYGEFSGRYTDEPNTK